ncbi:MAG: efflux RND transporter periplasmic adaptor subunit [Rhodobacter sp.]|nr:efflux RND transporter periplasmic adaptor subunit [Rhodobacter sp.]
MSSVFPANRVTAVIVLLAAAAWVATGEFSAVGSEQAEDAGKTVTPAQPQPAAAVRTVAAVVPVLSDYAREIRVSGVTEADKTAVLAARVDGIVQTLGVVQGQVIAADALVLRLEGAEIAAAVRTAETSLARVRQELEVGETLYAKGSLPELSLLTRRAEASAAEAALSQAQAANDRLTLRAPFAGTVDSVDIEVGEWVQAGTPIATLLSLDPIVIKAEIGERDIANVKVGSPALVRLVDGTELPARIRHVARQATEKTRTFGIDVALPNTDGKIPAGMTAAVRLFAPPVPAVTVPRSVLTLSEDGRIGLRVVGKDNIARFVAVGIIEDGEKGLVVAGIPEGVRVIVAGQDLIRDGDRVNVADLPAAQAAAVLQ